MTFDAGTGRGGCGYGKGDEVGSEEGETRVWGELGLPIARQDVWET